jgi:hypothetical protein
MVEEAMPIAAAIPMKRIMRAKTRTEALVFFVFSMVFSRILN